MGIFRQVNRPTYDEMARDQVASAMTSKPYYRAALAILARGKTPGPSTDGRPRWQQ
jgi:2-oxoglutarate ferredoxin oxidoreductase subunit beta